MKNLLGILVLLISCMACQVNNAQNNQTIDVAKYRETMNIKKDIQLIDVRTEEEYNSGHLKNAVNINYNANDFEDKIGKLDKSKPTFIYCLSGGRSASAMLDMSSNGFKELYNMKGGILQWKSKSFPLDGVGSNAAWKGMSEEDFNTIIHNETPTLVDFKAVWCGPCKQLAPILKEIETEYAGKIKVVTIDIDENKSLADAMKIYSIPFMIYYKNGEKMMNIEGLTDKETILKSIGLK